MQKKIIQRDSSGSRIEARNSINSLFRFIYICKRWSCQSRISDTTWDPDEVSFKVSPEVIVQTQSYTRFWKFTIFLKALTVQYWGQLDHFPVYIEIRRKENKRTMWKGKIQEMKEQTERMKENTPISLLC